MLIPFRRNDDRDGRIPEIPVHWDTEAYIPADSRDLFGWLNRRENCDSSKINAFTQIGELVRAAIHEDFRQLHDSFTHRYRLVDPDNDHVNSDQDHKSINSTRPQLALNPNSRYSLDTAIEELFIRANYQRLKPREIQMAMRSASHWGVRLRVRLGMFQRLRVYGRGDIVGQRTRRRWLKGFRLEEVDVPIYRRLIILFRVKEAQTFQESLSSRNLHLRMFKNIPKLDVDMLLPAAGVRMSWLDKGAIGVPTAWGFTLLVIKLAKTLSFVAVLGAFRLVSSVIFVMAFIVAFIVYGVRSVFSYLTAKRRHLLIVAQNLYFQNLDNNLGVLLRILDEAEQQEVCEAVLTLHALTFYPAAEGVSEQDIYQHCVDALREYTGVEIEFDVQDSIRDLLEMRMIEGISNGYRVVTLKQASSRMAERHTPVGPQRLTY